MNHDAHTINYWLYIYSLTSTVLLVWLGVFLISRNQRGGQLTWDVHTEYIDVSEFSNKNIPLKVSYRGTEPRWLWATYLSIRNTGRQDVTADSVPEKRNLIIGKPGCRYIGFNRLISEKAKVTLNPLFRENDVYCKLEFDRLGPGDEILCSLLYVADEKQRVEVEGNLFGGGSRVVSGYRQRINSWRSLWWLLLTVVLAGSIGGAILVNSSRGLPIQLYQWQIMMVCYLLALATAAVLLRPIRFWQQIPEKFQENRTPARHRFGKVIKFMLGLSDDM